MTAPLFEYRAKPAEASASEDFVSFAFGALGQESTQRVTIDGQKWEVVSSWAVLDGGRSEPIAVVIRSVDDPRPVTAELLRRLPIGTLHREARQLQHYMAGRVHGPATEGFRRSTAHQGSPTTEAEVRATAEVYLAAWGEGRPVTQAVADAFMVSKSTAGKRIMKARRAGLLDEAKRITR